MPDEIASIKRQVEALQQLYGDLAEEHYDCDKLIKQLLEDEADRKALTERLDELEMVAIRQLKNRVRENASELKRDRFNQFILTTVVVALVFAGFYFFSQMESTDQRELAKDIARNIALLLGGVTATAIGVEKLNKK